MTTLTEVMTPAVKAISMDATLKELAEFFIEEAVSGAPVVGSDRLVGVVSVTDLIEFDAEGRGQPTYETASARMEPTEEWPQEERSSAYFSDPWEKDPEPLESRLSTAGPIWNSLEEHTVEDVMTRQLLTLPVHADVSEAARLMTGAGVHRVLVMNDEELVGVVTTTDIVRAVAAHGLGG